ncbi:hypothetical protein K6119_04770 [Paracrocinitomix mangrovi]|uniref:hypothetical protein n=1 Tax=Paracrocinitomix mangrovi TaxID=2862509 RepID=UPI001C8DBA34|nr:hypothetical protein [Paracrocinitomix mangrovi]UKN02828.1 hypothetical protein K6119_04770 [Paracrocinitomix mangrovi]
MKLFGQISSVLFIALIMSAMLWRTVTILHFYANQDSIEQNHCENIDKPELNCHGHCYLEKKLTNKVQSDSPITQGKQLRNFLLVFRAFENVNEIDFPSFTSSNTTRNTYFYSIQEHFLVPAKSPPELS